MAALMRALNNTGIERFREYLAGLRLQQSVGIDPGVRAGNKQHRWLLTSCKLLEKLLILNEFAFSEFLDSIDELSHNGVLEKRVLRSESIVALRLVCLRVGLYTMNAERKWPTKFVN